MNNLVFLIEKTVFYFFTSKIRKVSIYYIYQEWNIIFSSEYHHVVSYLKLFSIKYNSKASVDCLSFYQLFGEKVWGCCVQIYWCTSTKKHEYWTIFSFGKDFLSSSSFLSRKRHVRKIHPVRCIRISFKGVIRYLTRMFFIDTQIQTN